MELDIDIDDFRRPAGEVGNFSYWNVIVLHLYSPATSRHITSTLDIQPIILSAVTDRQGGHEVYFTFLAYSLLRAFARSPARSWVREDPEDRTLKLSGG